MSKGLEALERIIGCSTIESHTKKWQQDYLIVEQALTELEKQTQILKILKEKKVDITLVSIADCVEKYNDLLGGLVEEEFDLLKEWLNDK